MSGRASPSCAWACIAHTTQRPARSPGVAVKTFLSSPDVGRILGRRGDWRSPRPRSASGSVAALLQGGDALFQGRMTGEECLQTIPDVAGDPKGRELSRGQIMWLMHALERT